MGSSLNLSTFSLFTRIAKYIQIMKDFSTGFLLTTFYNIFHIKRHTFCGLFYRISLWLPSMCHTELGPATVYARRRMPTAVLVAHPAGSTRAMLSRTLWRWTLWPWARSRAFTALGPSRRFLVMVAVIRSSRSLSFRSENACITTPYSL